MRTSELSDVEKNPRGVQVVKVECWMIAIGKRAIVMVLVMS